MTITGVDGNWISEVAPFRNSSIPPAVTEESGFASPFVLHRGRFHSTRIGLIYQPLGSL
jgi:hypothetical protein